MKPQHTHLSNYPKSDRLCARITTKLVIVLLELPHISDYDLLPTLIVNSTKTPLLTFDVTLCYVYLKTRLYITLHCTSLLPVLHGQGSLLPRRMRRSQKRAQSGVLQDLPQQKRGCRLYRTCPIRLRPLNVDFQVRWQSYFNRHHITHGFYHKYLKMFTYR